MIVTILGSCRQDSLYKIENITVTGIRDNVSYPHYSNEILEVIRYCKYGNMSPDETMRVFRSPVITNSQLILNSRIKDDFDSTDVFVIEIASRKAYKMNNRFVHHILYDDDQFNSEKDKIQVLLESDEEIKENILSMKNELNKPIIIVGHITTYQRGPRYELLTLLERICVKHDILFINPMVEMTKRGINTDEVFKDENVISHYTEKGHSAIKDIYTEFLQRITPTVNKKTVILTFNEKFANVKQDSNNWFFGLGDLFRAVISMYQLSKKHNFQLIV